MGLRSPVFLLISALPGVVAAQEQPLSLEEAVRTAIERHEDVGKARAAADALKGKIREVRAQALPDISIQSNAMRWRDPSLLNASGLDKFPDRTARRPDPVSGQHLRLLHRREAAALHAGQGRHGAATRVRGSRRLALRDRPRPAGRGAGHREGLLRPAVGGALPRPGGRNAGAEEAPRGNGAHALPERRRHGSGRAAVRSGGGQRRADLVRARQRHPAGARAAELLPGPAARFRPPASPGASRRRPGSRTTSPNWRKKPCAAGRNCSACASPSAAPPLSWTWPRRKAACAWISRAATAWSRGCRRT